MNCAKCYPYKGLFTWARLTGLARFPRSRLTSKSFVKFSTGSHEMAGWLGSRDLGFFNWDLGKRAGKFAIWTLQPGYRDESGMNSSNEFCIVLLCLLYFPHQKHPILKQLYSHKGCQSYNRHESHNFVFRHVCFVSRISRLSSSSAFSSRKPGCNFSY